MAGKSKFARTVARLLKTPPQPHSEKQKARTEKDLGRIAKGINPGASDVDRMMARKKKKPGK
jgi:hypothetical protein